jgi:hypothetical protein
MVIVILIATYIAHELFPKIEIHNNTVTVYKRDTITVTLKEVKYVHIPGRIDTLRVKDEPPAAYMIADTTFPDSAHLTAVAFLPPLSFFNVQYQPAPQKVVTLEKIVTNTVVKTETVIDLPWLVGAAAIGVAAGIYVERQAK